MVQLLATLILAYIIGSIPTGYIIVKAKTALDAIKGALPVILAKLFVTAGVSLGLAPVIAAVAVIIGHSKSCFLGFKGGKSVASGVGTILALNWMVGLIIAVVWGIITYATKYVSVGSMIALFISPFLMYFLGAPIAYVAYCALGAVYIIYLHRENIKRLINGNENKVR